MRSCEHYFFIFESVSDPEWGFVATRTCNDCGEVVETIALPPRVEHQ